jgi:aspartate-semialdehyde dehydrogenase
MKCFKLQALYKSSVPRLEIEGMRHGQTMVESYKIQCGILGATGMVGQRFITLLQGHPWFEIVDVAASPQSAGKPYAEAVKDKWQQEGQVPDTLRDITVRDANKIDSIDPSVKVVFSAIDLPNKDDIKALEVAYATKGLPVVSNNSACRWIPDVPMLIGEINSDHADIIPAQQEHHGFPAPGCIVVKPNCSVQSYLMMVHALEKAGYKVDKLIITTLQATSGAGYPGVPSLDLLDNVVPFIGGEEEKSEKEPWKILGKVEDGQIVNDESIAISATCTRVPVTDGHVASVNLKFRDEPPASIDEIIEIWRTYRGYPQEANLPFAPDPPIIYMEDETRPQPRKDRNNGRGMAITVGRLRKDNVFDYKFVALSHNTIRGAAGGGILSAEILKSKGYLG